MSHIIGMFATRDEAASAIHRLKAIGIGNQAISIAMKDTSEAHALAEDTGTNDVIEETATVGAISGAAVGALAGLAMLGTTILLPGLGAILVGGTLAGALAGAGVGGLIGALVGAGLPEHEAKRYAAGLEQGRVILSVTVPYHEAADVKRLFDEEGSLHTHLA